MNYILRALDPETDLDHFRDSYEWRTARRSERGGLTIPFDEYVAPQSNEVSFGLFNGQLQAVYLLQQRTPHSFQVHFSTRRPVDKDAVVAAAITLRDYLFQNGALEIFGLFLPEHSGPRHPLRQFAERIGFSFYGEVVHCGTVAGRQVVMLKFVARR